jgi:rhodanese-related sulfurtransferase
MERHLMTMKTAAQLIQEARQRVQNLAVEQVAEETALGTVTLVDLREPGEWAAGMIAGAIHVPRGLLEFAADPTSPAHRPGLDPHQRVILYCASGGRSALAADTLQTMGYTNVAHLDGGYKAWVAAGRPTGTP